MRDVRRTTVIALGLGAFLLGLCSARFYSPGGYLALVLVFGIGACIRKIPTLSIIFVILLGLTLGNWRGTVFMKHLRSYNQFSKKHVTIEATSLTDAVYSDRGQLAFDVSNIRMIAPDMQSLVGTIGVKGFGESMIYRGDKVLVTAKLYPTRGSKQASMSFAKITRMHSGTSMINELRRKFSAGLQSVVPEPLGSFGLGILIGQRTTLPKDINDKLSTVGLTHIVAVSGYNLTIIVLAVHRLTRKRSKYQSTLLTLLLIGLFLLLTGSSASIVRAAIVSILSLWAWYYGRTFRPSVLILLAASLTAGWFPPYIWSDIGWYLSFLAFTGVLLVAPLVTQRFMGKREPKILAMVLIETLAAQVMTLPIILFIFGRLSIISVFANILIVPLVPLAMMLSFLAGLGGMLLPSLAGWVAWPTTLLMTYLLDIVRLLSALPHASINYKINALQLVIVYILILAVLLIWWHKIAPSVKIKKLKPRLARAKQIL